MKKIFTVLGIIFAVILVIVLILAAIFIPRAIKLNHEAVAYIDDAVPKITTNWNEQELIDRATPELMQDAGSHEKLDKIFAVFKRLGAFKHLDEPVGTVFTSTYAGVGTTTIGNYNAQAQFEKGDARIVIQLRRIDGGWKINGFRVYSDVLLDLPKTEVSK